jgi:hypothetical protein
MSKAASQAEVVVKKLGDQPYVTRLLYADLTAASGIERWASEAEAANYLVGGQPEWVHVGGRVHACLNAGHRGLPYNACGFAGDFFFAALLPSGRVGALRQADKRRVFRWYEANKTRPPPASARAPRSPQEFERLSEAAREERQKRDEEWSQL